MIGSSFRFHVYYHTRRILFELSLPIPQDKSWNAFTTLTEELDYERICKEFNIDVNSDWRQKLYPKSDGLGKVYAHGHVA